MKAANVRVGHSAGELEFVPEALQHERIRGELRSDGLQRHTFTQLEILGFVDLAHSSPANETEDLKSPGNDLVISKYRLPNRPAAKKDRHGGCV